MTQSADEDRQLVAQARGGDFSAFEPLVAKYERRIFALAFRILGQSHDAEEVVQQTFLSVIEHLAGFREESSFYTWLMRIATNKALELLRRRKTRRTVELLDDATAESFDSVPRPSYIAAWRETPEEIASRRETRRILDDALTQLDDKYRLVFVLRDIEGLSTAETARALEITPGNVKVRLLRARLKLRELLTEIFGDESTRVERGDHEH